MHEPARMEAIRILVLSDTHGGTDAIRDAMPMIRSIDPHIIYHLGDLVGDAAFLRSLTETPVYSLRGNCDWAGSEPLLRIDEFGGLRILAAHGHVQRVKSGTSMLSATAKANDCAIALYGHTHQADIKKEDGLLIINPGSLTRPRGTFRRTMALILIENGKAEAALLAIGS